MSGPSEEAHVRRLVAAFPEFQRELEENFADGVMLSYVFYFAVTQWYLDSLNVNDPRATEFAAWLEREYAAADDAVENLIAVEFLENLPWPPAADADRVAASLGPTLRLGLKEMQDWRPRQHSST
jgi:hypothetical protein